MTDDTMTASSGNRRSFGLTYVVVDIEIDYIRSSTSTSTSIVSVFSTRSQSQCGSPLRSSRTERRMRMPSSHDSTTRPYNQHNLTYERAERRSPSQWLPSNANLSSPQ